MIPHSSLLSILEKVRPIWVFLVKDFALLLCQFVRVITKHVEDVSLVKREKPFAFHFFGIVNPPNDITFFVLDEFVVRHICLLVPLFAFRWKMWISVNGLASLYATILPFIAAFADVKDDMNA